VVSRGGRPDLAGDSLDRVGQPTLLIVGERDRLVLDLNLAARERLAGPTELAVVPGASHLFEEPGALEQWRSWPGTGSCNGWDNRRAGSAGSDAGGELDRHRDLEAAVRGLVLTASRSYSARILACTVPAGWSPAFRFGCCRPGSPQCSAALDTRCRKSTVCTTTSRNPAPTAGRRTPIRRRTGRTTARPVAARAVAALHLPHRPRPPSARHAGRVREVPVVSATRPPGTSTRANSAAACSGRPRCGIAKFPTTASTELSSTGRRWASPRRNTRLG
jgi:hypothetical protein